MKNRKIAALILSVMMVMCSMPSFVFAQENAPAEMQGAPAVAEEAPADEEAAADEAVGSDDAQEKSAKAKDPQETVKEESGEKVKAESIDGAGKEGEEKAEPEEKKPAFSDSKTVDGVKVTVSAEEGAFPEGAKLVVSDVNASEENKVDSAVDKVRDGDANVALSYVFDIHVEDKDGKEIQPADGRDVKVSFETEEVADSNLATDVYHVTDRDGSLKAEALDVKTDGDTASAGTDGFSYYTVEFTYGDLQYSMEGDTEVALSTILKKIGLTGTVTKAVSSNPDLFSVEKKDGEWKVTARQAFCSNETMDLTIDGIDYVVKVTDSQHDHTGTVHGISGWSPWNNATSLPSSGKHYLNTDVTVSSTIKTTGDLHLCLNGHTITANLAAWTCLYEINGAHHVYIYDSDDNSGTIKCSGLITQTSSSNVVSSFNLNGGVIDGSICSSSVSTPFRVYNKGTFNMNGGVIKNFTVKQSLIQVSKDATFNMNGGMITGNQGTLQYSYMGSVVYCSSYNTAVANLKGGTITGNTITTDGSGAINVYNDGVYNIGGNVNITGNTTNGTECNVMLQNNSAVKVINITSNLSSGAKVGLSSQKKLEDTETKKIVATNGLGTKGTLANFTSDNPDYSVVIENNEAYLMYHVHKYNYTLKEGSHDTIIAECIVENCPLPDNTATVKILPPTLETYGGEGSPEETFEGEIPGVTPTIVYKKGDQTLTSAPTNAGEYRAQVTLTGEDSKSVTAYVDYEIEKADITPEVNIENWNYGEDPNEPSVTAASNPGSGAVTYKYYIDAECTTETGTAQGAREAGGVPAKGGDYWVKATVAETDNYKSGTGTKKFTIATKAITAKGLKYDSKVYDGNTDATLDTSVAQLVGVQDGDKVSIKSATGTFDNKNVGEGKSIGSIVIELEGDDAGGYSATAEPESVTGAITAKPVKVSGITASDKIYDGNTDADLTFTGAAFAGIIDGDSLTVEGKTTQKGTFDTKNAGTGKTVTLPELKLGGGSAGNYSIKEDSQTEAKANITAKAISVTADDKSKTFDDPDPELTYTADALVTGDKFTGNLTRAEGENAGTYDINQGTLTAGDNYTISYKKGTFTINKAMTNSVTASIEGWTYGDDPKTPTAKAAHGQKTATFSYSSSKEGEYKAEVPATAGTWYVKATVAETDNYAGAVSEPEPFTIAKKEVGLDWTDTELTYNGEAQKPVATATGLVGEDECEVTVGGEQTDANARTGTESYEAEAIALDNPNYKLPEDVKKNFTIAPKELKQSMISLDSDTIKHDGTKKGPEVTMTDKDITEGKQPKQMAKDKDYTLSGDVSSSELGTHVITAEGKGNYTGSIETSWMMYSKKSNEQKEEGTGDRGDFEVFGDIESNTSDITVSNFTIDLAKGFLTEEDMARYNAGENVLVYMIIKEQPKSETGAGDRYILDQLFRETGATDISWYDITVWKKIGNSPATRVHDTGKEILMSVEVPDGQKNAPEGYTREFYMGRSHDGASKLLAQTSEVKVGFGSSKFSTYALAYKDTEKPKDDPGNGGNGGNGKGGSSKGGTKTGDPNDIAGLLALMLASGGALGAIGCRRRRSGSGR